MSYRCKRLCSEGCLGQAVRMQHCLSYNSVHIYCLIYNYNLIDIIKVGTILVRLSLNVLSNCDLFTSDVLAQAA